MDKVKLLIKKIEKLAERFKRNPTNFFHERELHSIFYQLCRNELGHARPIDVSSDIALFRQEYETIWRYKRRDNPPFSQKYETEGKAGTFDFVILNKNFVESNKLLYIINKDEKRRKNIRKKFGTIIDAAIEFKMAHIRTGDTISYSEKLNLKKGMLDDCRKCANEKLPLSVLLGFSHGPDPDEKESREFINEIQREFRRYNSDDELFVFIVTPDHIVSNYNA